MKWDSTLYDNKHDFVAEYGKALLEFVPHNPAQSILDLGCGTGTLTAQLSRLGKIAVGVDSSQSMISKAKEQFSDITFMVCDALSLPFYQEFDVVFSNAVFHWISDHSTLLTNIYKALKPGGMLICEFGADENIAAIENAFAKAYRRLGYEYESKFNFPTCKDFGDSLKNSGFIIDKIYDYDRPTPLKDGKNGLSNWMKQFFASELSEMPSKAQAAIIQKVEEDLKSLLWDGNEWTADYRRLRAVAHI